MRFNRLTSLALCLGVVLLLMVGSAFAGTTSFNSGNALKFAREVGAANATYTLPTTVITRTMNVVRATGQNWLIDVQLSGGAKWNSYTYTAGDVAISTSGETYTISLVNGPTVTGDTITYFVQVAGTPTAYPTITVTLTGKQVKDVANYLGGGNTITALVQTRDSATGVPFDQGTDTVNLMAGAYGVTVASAVGAGSATIDVGSNRTKFVGAATTDVTPTVGIKNATTVIYNTAGVQFSLTSADSIDFIISGDLTGITSVALMGVTQKVTATDKTNGNVTLNVLGDNANLDGTARAFTIAVDGTTQLPTRTLTVAINLKPVITANNRSLVTAGTTLTVWVLNGSVMTANWVNGNNAALNSRLYLWNPSGTAGDVSVAVYTLPNSTAGSTLLGTVAWGTLAASSGANIKLAEDILTPLGITLPYTTNGGNLVLIITVRASGVFGISQTFSNAFAYGTYALR